VIGALVVLAVAALGNLYSSWNSPAQLTGWSASGGDPCGAAWTGVSCSGSAVTSMYVKEILSLKSRLLAMKTTSHIEL
jgi:hypothetical protein